MRKSLQQSMCDALCTYLQARFDAPEVVAALERSDTPDSGRVSVQSQWSATDSPLPQKTISIVMVGAPRDTRLTEEMISQSAGTAPGTLDVVYRVKAREQQIQLDVWTHYAPERDAILSFLDDFLHAGPAITVGQSDGELVSDGILLNLPTGADYPYSGFCDCTFDGAQEMDELIREREARASIMGNLCGILTVKATSPKLAMVTFSGLLDQDAFSFVNEVSGSPPTFKRTGTTL